MRLRINAFRLFALSATCLAACSTAPPPYERPRIDLPQAPAAALTIERQWWKAFADPALDGLIEEALANNLDLAKAAANIEEARANAGMARSLSTPRIDGAFSTGAKQRELTFALTDQDINRTTTSTTAGAALNWEIDLWGRIRQMNAAAKARLAASEQMQGAVALSLTSAVAESWFQLRNLDEKLVVTRNAANYLKSISDLEYRRWQAAAGTELAYRKSLAELATTEAQIPGLEAAITRTEWGLKQLIGRSPLAMTQALPRESPLVVPPVPRDLDPALLLRRPDVAAAEMLLVAAHADVGSVRAELYPRLNLSLAAGIIATSSKAISGMPIFWDASLGLGAPLFDGGQLDAKVSASEARREFAIANYRYAVSLAFREAYEAQALLDTSDRQFRSSEQEVIARRKSLELTQKSHDAGRSSKFDVFAENLVLLNAERTLLDARLNQLVARARYFKAMGGGF